MRRLPVLGFLVAFALVIARFLLQSTTASTTPASTRTGRQIPAAQETAHSAPATVSASRSRESYIRRFIDPMVIVTAVAAVASATFAYQTNQINKHQSELLDRQVAIEESLALPIFTLTLEVERDDNGDPASHWIAIDNSGGLANDLTIDTLAYASFSWGEETPDGDPVTMFGDDIALFGYFDEYTTMVPSKMYTGDDILLGYDGNAAMYGNITGRMTDDLGREHGITDIGYSLNLIVALSYVDYMGTEREEYYFAFIDSTGEVFPAESLFRTDSETGSEATRDYYDKYDEHFFIEITSDAELPDDALISDLADRVYANRSTLDEDEATPVSTPMAASRDRAHRRLQ